MSINIFFAECKIKLSTKNMFSLSLINPLNAESNPICHLLALLGAHNIFHVSGLRVKHHRIWEYDVLCPQTFLTLTLV